MLEVWATTKLSFSPCGFQGEWPSLPSSSFCGTCVHNHQYPLYTQTIRKWHWSLSALCGFVFIHLIQEMKLTGKYSFQLSPRTDFFTSGFLRTLRKPSAFGFFLIIPWLYIYPSSSSTLVSTGLLTAISRSLLSHFTSEGFSHFILPSESPSWGLLLRLAFIGLCTQLQMTIVHKGMENSKWLGVSLEAALQ